MNLYIQRVCESAGASEPVLTDVGKRQAATMAAFLKRQIGRVDIVISSPLSNAIETAEVMAKALGSYVATTTLLSTDDADGANEEISRLAQQSKDVLVICTSDFLLPRGVLALGAIALVRAGDIWWMVTPSLIESTEELIEAARALAEAAGEYTYDEVEQKRWVLGSGGKSGENCEQCEENADLGWIDMDDVFQDTEGGDIDEPPGHFNCDCTIENRTRRVRVAA